VWTFNVVAVLPCRHCEISTLAVDENGGRRTPAWSSVDDKAAATFLALSTANTVGNATLLLVESEKEAG
jgi:hypothetical protein